MRLSKIAHFFAELNHSPIQSTNLDSANRREISVDIKRDDLLHPIVSGNKWRKLKHVLLYIESLGFRKVAVMGGPYSNLIHAIAYLANRLGWSIQLFIRGYPEQELTPMLLDAVRWGAKITYVNRVDFKQMRQVRPELPEDVFWIEEGGNSDLALKGTAELLMEVSAEYDYIITATATGTTLAGLAVAVEKKKVDSKVLGISVLNNAKQVSEDVGKLLNNNYQLPQLISGYEFGGYAKKSKELIEFIHFFSAQNNIPLEPIYSGKSFYAVADLIKRDYFPCKSKVLLLHCGGLQGARSQG